MKKRMLAGVACAALTIFAVPATGAVNPQLPAQSFNNQSTDEAVNAFYAARQASPLWLRAGADSPAARELIGVLERAPLDGLQSGPALAAQARAMLASAQSGDPKARAAADRFLSTSFIAYVQALQTPPALMTFADNAVAPRRDTPGQILERAAAAPSLAAYVRSVSEVNPLYAQLRDAAWAQMQASGGSVDARVLASLDRVRNTPAQSRYVMVDTAGAKLYMVEDGRIVNSMKVIVGKADPSTQTPMIASTIYYATLNPYWNVMPQLVRSLIAKNVLEQGTGYLQAKGYQVLSTSGELLDPAKVDWQAVAAGQQTVRVRQLPGPANSMGRMKFGLANSADIYLHDTPSKDLFAQDSRNLSHGCVRLEYADAFARWLLGRDPQVTTDDPEQNVPLPTPMPVYMTYLTAQVNGGQLSFTDDVYSRDATRGGVSVVALR